MSRKDETLRAEPVLERVADRVERGVVSAGDDEFREGCLGEGSERDLRLPRPPLGDECSRTLLELGRKGRRRIERRADRGEERSEKRLRIVRRPARKPVDGVGRETVDDGVSERHSRRGRLDHG